MAGRRIAKSKALISGQPLKDALVLATNTQIRKIIADDGLLPLDVLAGIYRHYWVRAQQLVREFIEHQALGDMDQDELDDLEKKGLLYLGLSGEAAYKAASFFHPRMNKIEMSGEVRVEHALSYEELSKLDQAELTRRYQELTSEGAATPAQQAADEERLSLTKVNAEKKTIKLKRASDVVVNMRQ